MRKIIKYKFQSIMNQFNNKTLMKENKIKLLLISKLKNLKLQQFQQKIVIL